MNIETHHRILHLKYQTARACLVIAKISHDKAKVTWKADHKNDQKRFKFQAAIGRLYRADKSVWMKQSHLPK